jgi:CheY-like chemotaxis protein
MPRVLVVEDEAPNVEILSRLLKRKGHEVMVAGDKADAIAKASAEQPDLILMDIGIPNAAGEVTNKEGGLEATQELRASETTQKIPIIAISAYAMTDEKERFLAAGCDAVQSKPFEFGSLLQTIEDQLSGNQKP